MSRDCVICGERFPVATGYRGRPSKAITCSRVCRNKLQWQRVPVRDCGRAPKPRDVRSECMCCGKAIWDLRMRTFCSRTCAGRGKTKDGLWLRPDGRLAVLCLGGTYILYSRALMCAHVGRMLGPDEIVHHVNEDETDDRIENLTLVSRAEHLALHRDLVNEGRRRQAGAVREANAA